jgi:AcrR family transcriptional regulator
MRRRPMQSRAYASSQALQEAFVRVLIEEGFEKTTVREVTAVAGVGIGTFYDYFGNMDALVPGITAG